MLALLSDMETVGESYCTEVAASRAAAEEGTVSVDCCLDTNISCALLPCVLAVETASLLSRRSLAADVGVCWEGKLAMLLWDALRLACCMRCVGVSSLGCSACAGAGVVLMGGGCC